MTPTPKITERAVSEAPPLEWTRVPLTETARQSLCVLVGELEAGEERTRARKTADRERLSLAMEAMVCALCAASADPRGNWRSYSRARRDYPGSSRYNRPEGLTLQAVTTVADWLLAQGYAQGQKGYFERNPFGGPGGSGLMSRIGATERLMGRLEHLGMTAQDVGHSEGVEVIILRGEKKSRVERGPLLEYEDTLETCRMRENVRRINEALKQYTVSHLAPEGEYETLLPFHLYRVFNNGSFAQGGRFFGGPWLAMRKETRPDLLIDGETVAELDFGSLHPRMIYAIEGAPQDPDSDPYEVDGWEGAQCRSWVKTAFNQLLNAGPSLHLKKPDGVKPIRGRRWSEVLEAVTRHHRRIDGWFRSGRGLELQRLDSDIAERVLLDMVEKGICCLPVHDSFIVPSSHADTLHSSMSCAYREVMGGECIKVDTPIIR